MTATPIYALHLHIS